MDTLKIDICGAVVARDAAAKAERFLARARKLMAHNADVPGLISAVIYTRDAERAADYADPRDTARLVAEASDLRLLIARKLKVVNG